MKPRKIPPATAAAIAQTVAATPTGARLTIIDSAARQFGCDRSTVYRAIAASSSETGIRSALELAESKAAVLRKLADQAEGHAQEAEREVAELRGLLHERGMSRHTEGRAA